MAISQIAQSTVSADVAGVRGTDLSDAPKFMRLLTKDVDIHRMAADIRRRGFSVLENFISETQLEAIRSLIPAASQVTASTADEPTGWDALTHTALGDLLRSPRFGEFCRQLYRLMTGLPAPETNYYKIFRRLQGIEGQKNSYIFHFDSYVLTVLIPIAIPDKGARGDLLIFPNVRPIRRSYFGNLIDKVFVDNALSQFALRFIAKRRALGSIAIRLRPGDVYFFLGYRSIHANEPCSPEEVRVTALIHYGDPHENNFMRSLIRQTRRAPGRSGEVPKTIMGL